MTSLIGELFVQCASGDTIVSKTYRHDLGATNDRQSFHELLKKYKDELPPHIEDGGRHFYHIRRQALYIVAVTEGRHLPLYLIEVLTKIYQLLKDFCGVVSEMSLRQNLVLVHELLDEVLDAGLVQLCSTERLKPCIQSQPVPVVEAHAADVFTPSVFGLDQRVVIPGRASDRPVIRSRSDQEMRKNEIFVDVIERISALIAANGVAVRCEVTGSVSMKSFLVGSPDIKVGLNNDLTIGSQTQAQGYGGLAHLDECTFNECVKMENFTETKMLSVRPPEGEFVMMQYRIQRELPNGVPFRLQKNISTAVDAKDVELNLSLRCDIPSSCHAVNIILNVPVPKATSGISQQLSGFGQTAEFVALEKKVLWNIKKMYGKSEVTATFKLFQPAAATTLKQLEIGPAALEFEISGYSCSNLQIRFLRVFDREHSYVPMRWLRYVTVADSYVMRLS